MNSSSEPGGYRGMPPDPWLNEQRKGPVPESLLWALRAGIGCVVCGLLMAGLAGWSINDQDVSQMESDLADQGVNITAEQLREMSTTVSILTLVIAAVLSAVWLWLLHRAYWRRNWARITLTVLGGIWLLMTAPSLTSMDAGAVPILLNMALVILLLVTLFGLHTATAREYFARPNQN